MKILFVNGFGGGEGGGLEAALRHSASPAGQEVHALRWRAGELPPIFLAAFAEVLVGRLKGRAGAFAAARVATERLMQEWHAALEAVPAAAVALASRIQALGSPDEKVSLLAFSLGSRVVMEALSSVPRARDSVSRVVFAGAAASASEVLKLAHLFQRGEPRSFINVYSDRDWVLSKLYQLATRSEAPAAGTVPIGELNGLVENRAFSCGHLGYRWKAGELLSLAGRPTPAWASPQGLEGPAQAA